MELQASQRVLKSQAADGDAAFLPLALPGIPSFPWWQIFLETQNTVGTVAS